MIFTSYFAQIRNFPENIIPLSISQYPPKWYDGAVTKQLAPPPELLFSYKGKEISDEAYTEIYTKKIVDMIESNSLNLDQIFTTIVPDTKDGLSVKNSNTNHIALCCFEKPTDFCHRHILADILSQYHILDMQELSKDMITQIKETNDLTLEDEILDKD